MSVVIASEPMRQLVKRVQRVAQTQAAVLILGESGSGKEVIARAIHHYSLRTNQPWVDVNCAALPDHLVESELFGYEKGAFSGAHGSKQGLFELAHTGTIYLDEIGELDAKAQAKLLRVLDGVSYYRIGGVRKTSVDVRVIAATNQNLEEMIQTGKFRADLYHRLSQIALHVPPLRSRRGDIVALAEFFLQKQNQELQLSEDAKAALTGYSWPGNIRELRNLITRAAVFVESNTVRPGDLNLPDKPVANGASAVWEQAPTNLEMLERQTILRVLSQTSGHQQKAADLLGISVRTLSRKLALYEANKTHAYDRQGDAVE